MDEERRKCVLVMDDELPMGLAANAAAVLGITVGRTVPEIVGKDVVDADGGLHRGIVEFPVPVLRATGAQMRTLRERLRQVDCRELTVVDFSDLAQSCRSYGEFVERMAAAPEESLRCLGIAICGGKRQVNRLTGNLPLLR